MTLNIFTGGLTFHLYGLVLGLSLVIWYLIFQFQAKKYHLSDKTIFVSLIVMVTGAIVGARLWHVITSWSLYASRPEQIFFIWQGGLSILGAVAGGVLGLLVVGYWRPKLKANLGQILAACALALPLSQATGRWGNYFNQELYGYPTQLPWGITIDKSHRLTQFLSESKFHPLFAYEIMALILIFILLIFLAKKKFWQTRPSRLFASYLLLYGITRFGLDFLRPDKTNFFSFPIGTNQVVCVMVVVVATGWLITQFNQDR